MENNNYILDILRLINNLQNNVINNDLNSGCTKPFLGNNDLALYNTRPVSFYLCNTSPLTITYPDGESSVFRVENIDGNCITVRLLATDENDNLISTNEFATVNINCIAAIRCLNDINLTL